MELVGSCCKCQTAVYCKGGFLDGVSDNHSLYCHSCFAEMQQEKEQEQDASASSPSEDTNGKSSRQPK